MHHFAFLRVGEGRPQLLSVSEASLCLLGGAEGRSQLPWGEPGALLRSYGGAEGRSQLSWGESNVSEVSFR